MQKNKDYFLDKIVKKNYNDELEIVLEKKNFDEHAKSLLLSMLYKIETAYKDYEKVKRNVGSKEEYIEKIIQTINNECNSIEIITPKASNTNKTGNRTFLIDKKNKDIKCFPIERKMLYSLSKIEKKEFIINSNYFLVSKTLSDLINVGNNIDTVEPLRDFNGYSWTTIPREIESIEHNLIYQNLRIILGHTFLENWIENREFIADYMLLIQKRLRENYGIKNQKELMDSIIKLSVMLEIKFDKNEKMKMQEAKKDIENKLIKMQNKLEFSEQLAKQKKQIVNKIKNIDTTINNIDLLEEEYKKRNEKLPLEKKIFSIRILADIMVREREIEFKKLEEINRILNPKNYVTYKTELEEKREYLKVVDINNLEYEIEKEILKLQKIFLNCFSIKIKNAKTPAEVMYVICEFRYYYLLNYTREKSIKDIENLQKELEKTIKLLIQKAKEQSVLHIFTSKEELDYLIFKNIFSLRIINLEDVYIKITKEKDIFYMQFFDDGAFEEKVELGNMQMITKKDLEIKLNKKIKVFN